MAEAHKNTVTPNLAYIPKKFHEFIIPSVRRVYLDTTPQDSPALKTKVVQLQSQVEALERDKGLLMERCESAMFSCKRYREDAGRLRKERDDAKSEADEARKETAKVQKALDEMKARIRAMEVRLVASIRVLYPWELTSM